MKKVIKITLWVLFATLVIGTFWYLYQKSQPKEIIYHIENVTIQQIDKRTVATGKVEPRDEVLIKPQISGIIEKVYKQAGDYVKMGDVIAKVKVIPDMVTLSSAESRLKIAQLNFSQIEKEMIRNKALYQKEIISAETYEQSRLQYEKSHEDLLSARDNLNLVREGATSANASNSNTLIRTTIDGTLLDVPIKKGNSVVKSNNFNDGTTIATIANMKDMLFIGKLDETEVGKMKIGMPMSITIGAMQDTKLNAQLEYISPKASVESGTITFQMKAAIEIPRQLFVRAGYSANAEIILEKTDGKVLTIPESCIEFSNDSAFVQRLTKEKPQTFEKRFVEIGLSDGINIEVKKGLRENDKIKGAVVIEEKQYNEKERRQPRNIP